METIYKNLLNTREKKVLYRTLPQINKKIDIDFSSNDYLSLNRNLNILNASYKAGKEFGVGSTGSRLLSGNYKLFNEFELKISNDKKTEEAIIFNSGFQCNVSVLSCLTDKKAMKESPLVFFDYLNHASLYQAVFLSKAILVRYRHNDLNHLDELLLRYKDDHREKFIVTETVFGMDGDMIDLEKIANIARKYKAFLYLDEAHATGVAGINGYGLSTQVDLNNILLIIMGTFSKALGVSGAYIACSKIIKDYLINFCPGFIYSTANSPLVIGAAYHAWNLLPSLNAERKTLQENSNYLREKIKSLGLNTGNSSTNIIPIILDKENKAIDMHKFLLMHGINTSCIRPPSVPPGKSRLRIALNTSHTKEDIDKLIDTLDSI